MVPVKILFITWDGPQTSYMEGLFMPILSQLQSQSDYVFHVVQFTWASPEKIKLTQKAAKELNITYTSKSIIRKPISILGNIFTLFKGIPFLKMYIKKNNINIVMPRSTMSAIMMNRIQNDSFKVIFDADGLPLEERVDFSGLSRDSKQYQFLKKEEKKILQRANGVLTRSQEAIKIYSEIIVNKNPEKFSVVLNGRNADFFKPNSAQRAIMRKELKLSNKTKVFVYCGSLGPQYGWDEMVNIFRQYRENNLDSLFLILTENITFAKERIPNDLETSIIIKTIPFTEIPNYLSLADVAFAIREPKFSMKGIAPIKLGEYLLMGIPTIASMGIGDSEQVLSEIPNCFLYDHKDPNRVKESVVFIEGLKDSNFEEIRNSALPYFSLEKSVESYCTALNKLQ